MRERPLERVDGQATFALGSRSRYPALRDEREVELRDAAAAPPSITLLP